MANNRWKMWNMKFDGNRRQRMLASGWTTGLNKEEVEVKEMIQNRQWDIARLSQLLSHDMVSCILKDISPNMSVGAQDKA
ncbi:hypothetical protein H5410_033753 [Solanum commersonii]|uniref:Uncharacterized protein n=1 Tax=Solanum commersonii TaxID=4109 RepID=A0A9J5YRI0_SOLCO|nr:hypothetical protein H5410_033753 [Solanum commersonii]